MKISNIIIVLSTVSLFLFLLKYYAYALHVPTYIFYALLVAVMFLYYYVANKKMVLNRKLGLWILLYFCLNSFYIMNAGFGLLEYKIYIPVIMMIVVFLAASLLYNLDTSDLIITRKSIAIALLIGVLLLIYDFIYPGSFRLIDNVTWETGRAVATYGNQNIVGAVFVLGLILTIDIIPKKYKTFYILYLFIGILVTFSRSNIMIYFLILFIMSIQNKISKKSLFLIVISILVFIGWLLVYGLEWMSVNYNILLTDNLTSRLAFFVDNEQSDTSNMSERKMVLHAALTMFMDNPIFGDGFAATRIWEHRVGPHNSFALTWAEFGLLGVLIIPSFLFLSTYDVFRTQEKKYHGIGVLFIIYYITSSIFSHNMLDQDFNLIGAVIVSMLGYKNRRGTNENFTYNS